MRHNLAPHDPQGRLAASRVLVDLYPAALPEAVPPIRPCRRRPWTRCGRVHDGTVHEALSFGAGSR